jgi:hypothetical protein
MPDTSPQCAWCGEDGTATGPLVEIVAGPTMASSCAAGAWKRHAFPGQMTPRRREPPTPTGRWCRGFRPFSPGL